MDRVQRRIGLVIGQLGYGGAEGQLYELVRALRDDARVVVYCLSDRTEPYGPMLEQLGVAVRVMPARGSFDLGRVLALARAIRADRVELVHAFLYIATAYAYLALLVCPGVRLVSSARNCKAEPNALRRAVMRRAFARSQAVICNSREMARFAVAYYRARPNAYTSSTTVSTRIVSRLWPLRPRPKTPDRSSAPWGGWRSRRTSTCSCRRPRVCAAMLRRRGSRSSARARSGRAWKRSSVR
jgi:hypothetical protein